MDVKQKRILHFVLSALTSGLWLPVWLYLEWSAKNRPDTTKQWDTKNFEYQIEELTTSLIQPNALITSLNSLQTNPMSKDFSLKILGCRLYESRQGMTVTESLGTLEAQTKTGSAGIGIGIGPVGLGVAKSTGQTKGTINSRSISKVGKDQMSKIDTGELVLNSTFIAFAGKQFSRNTDFTNLLSCSTITNEILVSDRKSDKNWLIAVNHNVIATVVGNLVEVLKSSDPKGTNLEKTIDQSILLLTNEVKRTELEIESVKLALEQRVNQG